MLVSESQIWHPKFGNLAFKVRKNLATLAEESSIIMKIRSTDKELPPPVISKSPFGHQSRRTSKLGIYKRGAVAIDAEGCARIGTRIMEQKNGTAVDAAIAALFCNGVVHPMSMGLGAGFVMTVYIRRERKTYALIARETAPRGATRDMFVGNPKKSRYGALAIATPGELLGYSEASAFKFLKKVTSGQRSVCQGGSSGPEKPPVRIWPMTGTPIYLCQPVFQNPRLVFFNCSFYLNPSHKIFQNSIPNFKSKSLFNIKNVFIIRIC